MLCYSTAANLTCADFKDTFPTLEFQLGDYLYKLPPSAYCVDYTIGAKFATLVGYTNQNNYVLGQTFMRNFYTQLDLADTKITLAVSTYAGSGVAITKVESGGGGLFGFVWWMWIIIGVLGVILLVLCFFGIRWAFKRGSRRGSSNASADSNHVMELRTDNFDKKLDPKR